MGDITFVYHPPKFWIQRSYISGFVGGNYLSNFSLSGQDLLFDYAPGNAHFTFRVTDQFFPATSNRYSLDHVFDEDNCFATVVGVHTPFLVNIAFTAVTVDRTWRIWVASDVPTDETLLADLAQMPSSYWASPR